MTHHFAHDYFPWRSWIIDWHWEWGYGFIAVWKYNFYLWW